MSRLALGGRDWAAGLAWTGDVRRAAVARSSRDLDLPVAVRTDQAAGFGPEACRGLPSLGLALVALLGPGPWVALVADDGGRRFLTVRAAEGTPIPDGEELIEDERKARDRFAALTRHGWEAFATPGLAEGVGGIDPAAPGSLVTDAMLMVSAPRARTARRAALALPVLLALAGGAAWEFRADIRLLVEGPPPPPEPEPEPLVAAVVDGAALIRHCRAMLRSRPTWLDGWSVGSVACDARSDAAELPEELRGLAGRPALRVRWTFDDGRSAPLHRRLTERRLASWPLGNVGLDGTASAVAPLPPVLTAAPPDPPSAVAVRRTADARLGALGMELAWRPVGGRLAVSIRSRLPLPDIADAVASVPGLEVVRIERAGRGPWRLAARHAVPAALPESVFLAMTGGSS